MKYHSTYKLNNKNIFKVFLLLIAFTFLLTSCIYGFIEIHYEKIIGTQHQQQQQKRVGEHHNQHVYVAVVSSAVADNNKNAAAVNVNHRFRDQYAVNNKQRDVLDNDMYKMVDSPAGAASGSVAGIGPEVDNEINTLFKRIDRTQMNIIKPLSADEVTSITTFKEKQVKLRKTFEERLNKTKGDDDEDDEDEEAAAQDLERAKQLFNQQNNKTNGETLVSVDRNLIVKYLKLEKHRYKNSKQNSIKTVKDVVSKKYDLNELAGIYHKYHFFISELSLYNDTKALNEVADILVNKKIRKCVEKERGTQIKVILTFNDGTHAMMKPMRVKRDYETPPDHFYFNDFERHYAEIAAYHVDKVLNFYRVPPTFGRMFNLTEIWKKADTELEKTFYYSPAGNICFTGHCSYYCDTTHAICGKPVDILEGSVQLMLPRKPYIEWKAIQNPYKRSYNKKRKADWETNLNYCYERVYQDPYYHSKNMLDLMDLTIFDFITGNLDRHHYEKMITINGDETFALHLDNGRAFGKAFNDEISILEPIKQCCLLRYSTYLKLKELYNNKFSTVLNESLKSDVLFPILTNDHLRAVDRRLAKVLIEIGKCVNQYNIPQVIVDDGYGY